MILLGNGRRNRKGKARASSPSPQRFRSNSRKIYLTSSRPVLIIFVLCPPLPPAGWHANCSVQVQQHRRSNDARRHTRKQRGLPCAVMRSSCLLLDAVVERVGSRSCEAVAHGPSVRRGRGGDAVEDTLLGVCNVTPLGAVPVERNLEFVW